MTRRIVTAAEGGDWESALLASTRKGSSGLEIARRCVDLVDLLAVAGAGLAEAALVDVALRRLDSAAVERLTTQGVAVIGVIPAGVPADEERLASLGIDFVLPGDADLAVAISVVDAAIVELTSGGRQDRGVADPSFASRWLPGRSAHSTDDEPRASDVTGMERATDGPVGGAVRSGRIVAVWGPTGAPGRTTLAVTLADELARLNQSVMLIDADVYGGVIASSFGLLDESPGLAAACRQAQSRRLDRVALAQISWQVNPQLRLLTGIQRADRWPELRVNAIEQVLSTARTLADVVVVDLGFNLETDEELSFDTAAPRRNGATLTVLDNADLVLAVGSADPVGVQRLVRGLADLSDAGVKSSPWVVMNRVRKSAVPGDTGAELEQALHRFSAVVPQAKLPYDLESLDLAAVHGRTVAEVAPNSPFRRAVVELAAAVAGVEVPARGRRRR